MLGDDLGESFILETIHNARELTCALGVKVRGGFVEYEGLRRRGADRGDGDPLLLAVRKRIERTVADVIEFEIGDGGVGAATYLVLVHSQVLAGEGYLSRQLG